jgi:acyl dehydratase
MPNSFASPRDLLTAVGRSFGPTDWFVIDQARINMFGNATGDELWIHTDPDRARQGPFGGCIAHGYLTLSLLNMFLPQLLDVRGWSWGVNYGCDKVRFPEPVRVGSRVRASGLLLKAEEKENFVHSTVRMKVEIDGNARPACVADTLSRYYFDPKKVD